jgi:hypothetical protein
MHVDHSLQIVIQRSSIPPKTKTILESILILTYDFLVETENSDGAGSLGIGGALYPDLAAS